METNIKSQKKSLESKAAKECDLTELLTSYDKEVQPAGTSVHVSMEDRVYRAKVVKQFLYAGIPISKIDSLRGLLEENALRLTHSSHLLNFIPPLLKKEKQAVCQEVEGKDVSVCFDGTSRVGEALAIVIHYCSGWTIKQI